MLTKEMCHDVSKILDFEDLLPVMCQKVDKYDSCKECCLTILSMVVGHEEIKKIVCDLKLKSDTEGLFNWLCGNSCFPEFDEDNKVNMSYIISNILEMKKSILNEFVDASLRYNSKMSNPCLPESFGIKWIQDRHFELAVLDSFRNIVDNRFRTYSVVYNAILLAKRKRKYDIVKKKIWNVLVKFLEKNGDVQV